MNDPLATDRIILLGTKGGPSVRAKTSLPSSNALIRNGKLFVIDAGYGVSLRLVEAGLPLAAIEAIFITHHHSDHTLELGVLIHNSWVGGRKTPVHIYGPPETKHLVKHFLEAYRFDIKTRIADEGRPDLRQLVFVHEFSHGDVAAIDGMRVSALRNVHPPIQDSFSLKFASGDRKFVFSGDTTFHPPLAEFAQDADVLVHEVMCGKAIESMIARYPNADRLLEHLKASHTLMGDVGRIATQARARKLVLNHFVPGDDPFLTERHWREGVAQEFGGEVIVGKDLMEIEV